MPSSLRKAERPRIVPMICSHPGTAAKFDREASHAMKAIQQKNRTMKADRKSRSHGFCSRWIGNDIRWCLLRMPYLFVPLNLQTETGSLWSR